MQNITFLSLSIYSLLSSSPFYAINRNSYKKFSFIANSYFHHSISSIIYSNTEFHSTKIHKNVYNQMLNTPLVFENEELGFCMYGEKCCVGNDYNFTVGSIEYRFVTDPSEYEYPEKKKRRRKTTSPRKNALTLLHNMGTSQDIIGYEYKPKLTITNEFLANNQVNDSNITHEIDLKDYSSNLNENKC